MSCYSYLRNDVTVQLPLLYQKFSPLQKYSACFILIYFPAFVKKSYSFFRVSLTFSFPNSAASFAIIVSSARIVQFSLSFRTLRGFRT